jgi:UDP-N-acetylglucosamine 2-epimerase
MHPSRRIGKKMDAKSDRNKIQLASRREKTVRFVQKTEEMKIVTILGVRPQFIRAESVSREISSQVKNGKSIVEVIIHTGQHYDVNMRDETELVELADNGFNVTVGADKENFLNAYVEYIFQTNYNIDLYGSGKVSKTIVKGMIL